MFHVLRFRIGVTQFQLLAVGIHDLMEPKYVPLAHLLYQVVQVVLLNVTILEQIRFGVDIDVGKGFRIRMGPQMISKLGDPIESGIANPTDGFHLPSFGHQLCRER